MMMKIDSLSYWERNSYFTDIDFLVVGSGIVGCSTALHLKQKYPTANVLVLERAYLPMGASTKNAGFACFGSLTELCDDLGKMDEDQVWETVQKRFEGLNYLKEIIGIDNLSFEQNGSWDLIDETTNQDGYSDKINYLNGKLETLIGEKNVFSEDTQVSSKFKFQAVKTSYFNRLEGQIDTGKMMHRFHQLLLQNDIKILNGIEVAALVQLKNLVEIETNIGLIQANNVCICVNGFAQQLLPKEDVQPARAQVLITKPISNLHIKGTFHYQMGYYYFRNIHNRILFGGGRNLDFQGETSCKLENTDLILNDLKKKLKEIILPQTEYEIDYSWAGIMGVGASKKPIIKMHSKNIAIGVRMGGMGIAIGSLVGKETSELF